MTALSNTIKLGIFFMFLLTSHTSFGTIISQLYRQIGYTYLGRYSTFAEAGFLMVSLIFVPLIGSKINAKWLMLTAGCCYSFNYFTGFIITFVIQYEWLVYGIAMLGAALAGMSSSVLWVSQGSYIHTICQLENKQNEKGYYFGVFYRMSSISCILAGIATTFLLGFLSPRHYFLIISGIGISASLQMFLFIQNVQTVKKIDANMEKMSLISEKKVTEHRKQKFDPRAIFKFYPKMLVMLPFIGLIGFLMGFYSTSLTALIAETLAHDSTKQYIRLRSGIGIICLGFGEMSGGYFSGKNADLMNIKTIGGIAISIYLATVQTSMITDETKNQILVYFAAYGWGLTHSYLHNWVTIVCSRNYQGRLESFAVNRQFHALTLCIYELFLIFESPTLRMQLTILSFLTVICIITLTQLKEVETRVKTNNQIDVQSDIKLVQ